MVALKASDAETYVARPDPARPIALLFGPDAGLVSERAEAIIRSAVDDINDPFALVKLTGDDLASDPARLVDEANTVPLPTIPTTDLGKYFLPSPLIKKPMKGSRGMSRIKLFIRPLQLPCRGKGL